MYSRGKTIAKLVHGLAQLPVQQLIGDILITASRTDAYDGVSFATTLRNFRQNVLRKLLPKGVGIITRSLNGRLHWHLAVQMPVTAPAFDWTSFEESERYFHLYQTYKSRKDLQFYHYYTRKFRTSLPLEWRKINQQLMIEGKKHGLGRVFLTPVRKNLQAFRWYLVGNVPYRKDDRDKGLQYFTSWGLKRMSKCQLLSHYTADYRRHIKRFAEGLQLSEDSYKITLRSVLGRYWYFRIKDLVRDIDHFSMNQAARYDQIRESLSLHILRSR